MGSVKEFFVKVNKDPSFRNQFLNSPAETLASWGINLPDDVKSELMTLVPVVKKHLPELASIPGGYGPLLDEVEKGGDQGMADDPSMLIL